MIQFYYTIINRRDFGDLISERKVSFLDIYVCHDFSVLNPPTGNSIIAVWSLDPKKSRNQLPEVLICAEGSQEEWAAWLCTYAVKIRPFSAYLRLMTYTEFLRTMNRPFAPEISPFIWPIAGLILGEVLGTSGLPDKALETLSATAFASTLTFVMFRAAAMHDSFSEWQLLVDRWESVRSLSKQKIRPIDSIAVARVCAVVLDALNLNSASSILTHEDFEISTACRALFNKSMNHPYLITNFEPFRLAESRMYGTREDRVIAFQDFLKMSFNSSVSKPHISFMLGYLASRIAPGTIKHASLLSETINLFPTAILWYGFCAGFAEEDTYMANINGKQRNIDLPPSARRIIRDLLRPEPIVAAPVCDISYLELLTLSRTGGDPLEPLIKTTQGSAYVELLPGVSTSVSVTPKQQTKPPISESRELEIISTIGEQIEHLHETYKKLTSNETLGLHDKQHELFPKSKRKKK